jgi:VIT1/CCC1 family predicted Fe2+/Mn2+ transporter
MTPEEYNKYLLVLKSIMKHLKQRHGLVVEKQYIKRFVSIGVAFGLFLVMLGYVLISFGITILVLSITLPALIIRIFLGYIVGYLLDRRAKKQGRVI